MLVYLWVRIVVVEVGGGEGLVCIHLGEGSSRRGVGELVPLGEESSHIGLVCTVYLWVRVVVV